MQYVLLLRHNKYTV